MLGVPRPDINFVLRVPADEADSRISQRAALAQSDKPRDIHEADPGHLASASVVYDDICQLFPKDFARVDCLRDGQPLNADIISGIIWGKVEPLLPDLPSST